MQGISQSKIRAFNVGRMNPLKKPSPFLKKKEEKEERKKVTLHVFMCFYCASCRNVYVCNNSIIISLRPRKQLKCLRSLLPLLKILVQLGRHLCEDLLQLNQRLLVSCTHNAELCVSRPMMKFSRLYISHHMHKATVSLGAGVMFTEMINKLAMRLLYYFAKSL